MPAENNTRRNLMPLTTVTTAVGATALTPVGMTTASYAIAQAKFVYGSGGTSVDVYVQTSLDGGATWIDIMEFNFLTTTATKISACTTDVALAAVVAPTDGTLTANTIVNGLLGDRFRVKWKSTGTYAGNTTIQVDLVSH